MAVIIEKQRIAKRQRRSPLKLNNKSAGFNSSFMSQFKQKPLQAKWQKKRNFTTDKPFFLTDLIKNIRPETHKKFPRAKKRESGNSSGSGFSFPVPSLATLAVIAGTVVIALAAQNWEGLDIRTPNIYAIQPSEDENAEQRIIQYAATGIPSLFHERPEVQAPSLDESLTDSITVNNNNDNPHGMLVTFEWQQYRVQRGDSVSGIAHKFGVSVGAIIASNDIRNARRLQEGASLRIPNIDGIPYQVQRGDSLLKISASFNVPLEVILDVNDIKSDNIKVGETIFIPGARMNDIDLRLSLGELFAYPLQSRFITSHYGMRKDPITGVLQFHAGVDFRANTGTTVMASLDGIVSVVSENRLYGKYIIISHTNGYKTFYAHLNSVNVRQGDRVTRGRKIGEVGNTGYSTGPHLHFGIYDKNNRLINPLELLN
ncbi:MAG: M23 family metallopeptidase [Treponema sp.]|nr:M23 family metallopeptidase [Treponema sp.]